MSNWFLTVTRTFWVMPGTLLYVFGVMGMSNWFLTVTRTFWVMPGTLLYVCVYVSVILNRQKRCTPVETGEGVGGGVGVGALPVAVCIHWTTNRNWLTKQRDTRKETQQNVPVFVVWFSLDRPELCSSDSSLYHCSLYHCSLYRCSLYDCLKTAGAKFRCV